MTLAYVGLGSNLDAPQQQLVAAVTALAKLPGTRITARSHDYATPPWGVTDQPEFVNAVVALATELEAHTLMLACLAIEQAQGRRRDGQRWGPRTLDLDVLLYGDQSIDSADLRVPHPRLAERAFVLLPLAEIAPDVIVPGMGRVADLLTRVDVQGCRKLA